MDNTLNKKLNSATISLNYLNKHNDDIQNKINKLEDSKYLLNVKLENNKNELKEFTNRRKKIIEEIKKGDKLLETIQNNNKILNKLYNL